MEVKWLKLPHKVLTSNPTTAKELRFTLDQKRRKKTTTPHTALNKTSKSDKLNLPDF